MSKQAKEVSFSPTQPCGYQCRITSTHPLVVERKLGGNMCALKVYQAAAHPEIGIITNCCLTDCQQCSV